MKKGLIILIVLGLGGFCVYHYYWKPKYDTSPIEEKYVAPASAFELPLINIKNENRDITEKNIRINKDIPEVKILSNQASAEIANSYIRRFVEDEENKFLKKVDNEMILSTQAQNIINSFSISTKIVTNTPKIFILRFDENSLTQHANKPDSIIRYMMFSVEKGQMLMFENIFKDKEGATKAISDFLTQRGFNVEDSIRSLKTNHKYVLTKEGLSTIIDTTSPSSNFESKEVAIPFEIISEFIDDAIKEEITSDKEYIRMSNPI